MILFFELGSLNHKPKLLGITACSAGAGTSTIAAGLAASLSETGDGKVLLVDMGTDHAAAHPFFDVINKSHERVKADDLCLDRVAIWELDEDLVCLIDLAAARLSIRYHVGVRDDFTLVRDDEAGALAGLRPATAATTEDVCRTAAVKDRGNGDDAWSGAVVHGLGVERGAARDWLSAVFIGFG